MTYTHLLFDFDHLLFDTDQSEALGFAYALAGNGVPEPERLLARYQVINQSLWRQVEAGAINPNELKVQRFEILARQERLNVNPHAVARDYTEGLIRFGELYPGALELVTELAADFTLAMVTNGLGPVQRGRLERVGLGGVFEPLVISGEVGASKPRAAIFEHVFAAHPTVDRSAFLMVGDSLASDIAGGTNAGIDTCWFNRLGVRVRDSGATHEIHHLGGLRVVVR